MWKSLAGGRVAGEVGDRDRVRGDRDDLVLAQLDRLAGVLDERGDVAGEVVLAGAPADHERRVAARADHRVRLVGVDGEQRERALQPAADPAHRLGQRRAAALGVGEHLHLGRVQLAGEQVRDALGVGVADELDAALLQLVAQPGEVLDDPVVDHGDPAVGGQVRVRVAVGRAAVGGPAGVPDRRSGRPSSRSGRPGRPAPSPGWPACRRASRSAAAPSATTATPAES